MIIATGAQAKALERRFILLRDMGIFASDNSCFKEAAELLHAAAEICPENRRLRDAITWVNRRLSRI